jgi:hypothetical protein
MFASILKFVFNSSLSQNTFSNFWKQAAVVHVFL